MLKFLIFAGLVACCLTQEVKHCKNNSAFKIHKLSVSPYPVDLRASKLSFTVDAELTQDIIEFDVALSIKKKVGFIWIPIPCVSNAGSCTYKQACGEIAKVMEGQTCPPGVQCTCPFTPHRVTMSQTVDIPPLPSAVISMASGTIWVEAKIKDHTGKQVGCIEITAKVK